MKKAIVLIFWLSLVAFLVLGAGIVGGQFLGVVIGSSDLVAGSANLFNWPAFSFATVCALAAFTLSYFPSEREAQPDED